MVEQLLSCSLIGQVLVFSNYTSIAQATADFLNSRGFPAVYMSAVQDQARWVDISQSETFILTIDQSGGWP